MLSTYTITFADFKAAQRLCWRRNRWTRLRFLLWYALMPVVGVVALALFLYGLQHAERFPPWLGGVMAALAWLAIFPTLWRPVQVRLLYRRMKDGLPDSASVELELAEDELISRRPGLSEGRFRRAALCGYAEDDHIALIFVRKKLFLPVPRRALDAQGWAELRQWIGDTARRRKG